MTKITIPDARTLLGQTREENQRLREEIAKVHEENFALAAWQCIFHDGKTGIVCDEHGNQYCAKAREVARLEEELTKVREVNAEQAKTIERLMEDQRQAQQRMRVVRSGE